MTFRFLRDAFASSLLTLTTLGAAAAPAEFFIAPTGNDKNPGTSGQPFASIEGARDALRKSGQLGKSAIKVHLADGTYFLPQTLVFTPQDSGTAAAPVRYEADHEGAAIISGGLPLKLTWKPYRDGILQAQTPAGLQLDQLFAGGTRQLMARYPNFDPEKKSEPYNGYAADAISKERAARWANPAGGYIHAMHAASWGGYHYLITGKKDDGSLAYEGGWQNNRQGAMHPKFRMVENIFEELDAPGEWFHDRKSNTLYFYPPAGLDPNTAPFEGVLLANLVEFRGTEKAPVKFITLKGLTFRHAARTFMENKEPLLRSDWTIHRGGAAFLTGAEDCGILDSTFDQVGSNAVFASNYNRRLLFKGLHIFGSGASGIAFVGDPDAVRNPLFEYGRSQDLTKIDRTPGPKTNNYPAESIVEDCLLHRIGLVEKQGAGVQISMSQGITLRHCSIYDTSRAGINISEGTWGGHLIEFCDVFDTVLETHDHGSFNSWGRDRYWTSNHRGVSQPEVMKDPKLPFLDAWKTTVIRNSRWRCDHGWDIDLDDGSSNYEIYNNLLLHGGLKFREGYGRKAYNNVIVNNGFHPHVWFDDSKDELYSNILMKKHAAIGMPQKWGARIDSNLFTSEADRSAFAKNGCDEKSIAGDPMFVDPATGNFSVKEGSPAFKIGFKNFPMDQFGVVKASLKSIARTPVIPALEQPAKTDRSSQGSTWLGADIRNLEGEEFSAFGVSRESGGIHLSKVSPNSAAARAGFRTDDLIQGVNGKPVKTMTELFAVIQSASGKPLGLTFIRNQKTQQLTLNDYSWTEVTQAADAAKLTTRPGDGKKVAATFSSNQASSNAKPEALGDGKLAADYGPVFANGVKDGLYKAALVKPTAIAELRAWSYRQSPQRVPQKFAVYGSNAEADPGWNVVDATKFTALATVDTSATDASAWQATRLRATGKSNLGTWRWIIWAVAPPNGSENTTYQELEVIGAQ